MVADFATLQFEFRLQSSQDWQSIAMKLKPVITIKVLVAIMVQNLKGYQELIDFLHSSDEHNQLAAKNTNIEYVEYASISVYHH